MLCLQQLVADEMPTDGFIYAAQSIWAASSRRVELIRVEQGAVPRTIRTRPMVYRQRYDSAKTDKRTAYKPCLGDQLMLASCKTLGMQADTKR